MRSRSTKGQTGLKTNTAVNKYYEKKSYIRNGIRKEV